VTGFPLNVTAPFRSMAMSISSFKKSSSLS
jgi:hypothetical protein